MSAAGGMKPPGTGQGSPDPSPPTDNGPRATMEPSLHGAADACRVVWRPLSRARPLRYTAHGTEREVRNERLAIADRQLLVQRAEDLVDPGRRPQIEERRPLQRRELAG